MQRRNLLIGSGAAFFYSAVGRNVGNANAQDDLTAPDFSEPPASFPAGVRIPTLDEYSAQLDLLTGKQNPFPAERAVGEKLLTDIRFDRKPWEIAFRFHEWRIGAVPETTDEEVKRQLSNDDKSAEDKLREQYRYYSREWPVRGNPVIMTFFDATGYRTPAGDATWWCAAFVSWCLQASKTKKGDKVGVYSADGAASASYRSYGNNVIDDLHSTPRRGDLAVFVNIHDQSSGHVGFVYSNDENGLKVLGGNQGAQNEYNGGEVNIAPFSTTAGKSLRFHSFRRHKDLG